MGFLTDHPYTAITVTIDRLVTEDFEEDDVAGVFDLIETIRLSPTGPTEAARALRKKLKYGTVHNQLRALTLMDALIENGSKRFQASFADEPLLERMRILATDNFTDIKVKKKLSQLFLKWASKYKDVQGMHQLCMLYKQLPQRKRAPAKRQPRFVDMDDDMDDDEDDDDGNAEDDDDDDAPPPKPTRPRASSGAAGPSTRSERTGRSSRPSSPAPRKSKTSASTSRVSSTAAGSTPRGSKRPTFDLQKEKPLLMRTLAEAGTEATNLQNALKLVNREKELSTDNIRATECFNKCRKLRRLVLRFIQHIESEDYIGSLIHANEELVAALQLYDKMSQPIDEDSDSEEYDSESEEDELERDLARTSKNATTTRRSASAHASSSSSRSSHSRTPSAGGHVPTAEQLAHKRRPPPIPVKSPLLSEFKAKMAIKDEDEVEDDPFGDAARIETPRVEKKEMSWREV
ncbi:hypothetical protein BZA70DRAFT_270014 [Myxozyma melibiosi]|uniref:VHS domain-containing protein n=1 Tax=Myxozyma melibiosi TaxID=54550 RepID=A0ABR1F008_9ASCO